MRTVSVSDLKASLSEHLSAVRKGEEVVVTDRGVPVARISRIEGLEGGKERRARLARQGILRLGSSSLRTRTAPAGKGASGVLAALLEERAEDH